MYLYVSRYNHYISLHLCPVAGFLSSEPLPHWCTIMSCTYATMEGLLSMLPASSPSTPNHHWQATLPDAMMRARYPSEASLMKVDFRKIDQMESSFLPYSREISRSKPGFFCVTSRSM